MKLYFSSGACSMAPHIAAREAGIQLDLIKVNLMTHKLESGENYKEINPRGYVPLLELDDGSRHTEAAALLQYIGDLDPTHTLLPAAGTRQRFEVIQWLTFISTELHKVFSPWLWHKETAESTKQASKEKLATRFAELDQRLSTRDYLVTDNFTVADAYCFTIVNWCNFLDISLNPYPALSAYMQRIANRPKVQDVFATEGLKKAR